MDIKVLRWPKSLKDIYFLRGLKEEKGLDLVEYYALIKKFDKLVEDEPKLNKVEESDEFDFSDNFDLTNYDEELNDEEY